RAEPHGVPHVPTPHARGGRRRLSSATPAAARVAATKIAPRRALTGEGRSSATVVTSHTTTSGGANVRAENLPCVGRPGGSVHRGLLARRGRVDLARRAGRASRGAASLRSRVPHRLHRPLSRSARGAR